MKARYVEPSIRISITITDRERISCWGRTRPSHDPFRRQQWGQSWQCRRSADCTTATNDGSPERATLPTLHASCSALEICLRTTLPCPRVHPRISFTKLEQVRELLGLRGSLGGITSAMGCTEFSLSTVGDNPGTITSREARSGVSRFNGPVS
jgi:hypothetical protein